MVQLSGVECGQVGPGAKGRVWFGRGRVCGPIQAQSRGRLNGW